MKQQLWIDLDGVLCDFLGGFQRKFGIDFFSIPEEDAWVLVKEQPNLWAELDPLPGAKIFWSTIKEYKPIILTAVPKTSFITSAQNKREWIRNHLGHDILMIPCQGGYNKAGYITQPGDILVDDMKKNIDPWNKHGGRGILFEGDYADVYNQIIYR